MRKILSPIEQILIEKKDDVLTEAFLKSVTNENFSEAFIRHIFQNGTAEMKKTFLTGAMFTNSLINILLETDIQSLKKCFLKETRYFTDKQLQKMLEIGDMELIDIYFSKLPWQCAKKDPTRITNFPPYYDYGRPPQQILMENGYILYAGKLYRLDNLLRSPSLDYFAKEKILYRMILYNIKIEKTWFKNQNVWLDKALKANLPNKVCI